MKNSEVLSSSTPPPSAAAPRRNSFALVGRSVALDPLTHAVRSDLADIRLAHLVFAPHYAAPLAMIADRAVGVTAAADGAAAPLCRLEAGDVFEALDLCAGHAWGIARRQQRVGYVDRAALRLAPEAADAPR